GPHGRGLSRHDQRDLRRRRASHTARLRGAGLGCIGNAACLVRAFTRSVACRALQFHSRYCSMTDADLKKWGPYLSERQWGTVREDYSPHGNAWDYFPHDHARSRAYRWGEDGIAGFSDDQQRLCLSVALWNGCDPILKERLFGLTNGEGN